ncbi:MAG TPA: accessory factor UbiK family protein [Hyphomicrobiales bacterium]|nr:accessory factor UbiK family protein [Hyphomicrobiales bacterium]
MTQTTSRLFDELARLMTDAAGAAQGARKEFETMMRGQAEKILRDLDVVSREEFEAVREMAQKAREENAALATRVAKFESAAAKALAGKPAAARPKAKPAAAAKKSASPRAKAKSAPKAKKG